MDIAKLFSSIETLDDRFRVIEKLTHGMRDVIDQHGKRLGEMRGKVDRLCHHQHQDEHVHSFCTQAARKMVDGTPRKQTACHAAEDGELSTDDGSNDSPASENVLAGTPSFSD